MLKKINCYLCILLLLLISCQDLDGNGSEKVEQTDKKEQTQPEQNDKNNQNGQDNQNGNENEDEEDDEEPKNKNLGSIFFFGNSHTFNTANLETMIKENGYEAKIYHIHTGGNIPLGNDWYGNNNESTINTLLYVLYGEEIDYFDNPEKYKERYRKNVFSRNHLSNLLTNDKQQIFRNDKKEEIDFFTKDLSWIVVHDGSVYNSLTSAGAFMGLASSLGAKVACYQSWDLKEQSAYAAKKFQLPMIPVGGVIRYPEVKLDSNGNSEYQVSDGHMNNKGKYIYCVLFTHFFTGLSIDEIKGNAGLPKEAPKDEKIKDKTYLTEENKKEMKELMKKIVTDTDKIFKDIKPYYECVKDFGNFKIDKACKSIEPAKEYTVTLQLSQPAVFKLPESKNDKKLKVEVKSNKENIIPDIWFYDAKDKKLTEQSTNTGYLQNYTFMGEGKNWETDGSKMLIITRRGKTTKGGNINNETFEVRVDDSGFDTVIEESVNETVDFKITVSFE